ncbi:hypothetical protein GCM10011391_07510 [Pullulanibacillus camelliae]|uniref:Uncharacterized protein n=1 Tax=Pullulanibacillus camelliae TaxID=1707096 RepID=A0A8J2VLN9_9BACL|nr:hypothetical protein GCM10011391_07510 [Pullulanibacillus camelliae]
MSLWLTPSKACGHPKCVIGKNHIRSTSEVVQAKFSKKIRRYKISDHKDGADFRSRPLTFRGGVVSLLALRNC